MRPTLRNPAAAVHVHKPLIHFIGKRHWPAAFYLAAPSPPAPHPAGPPEYKAHFSEFLNKFNANQMRLTSSASSTSTTSASASTPAPTRSANPAAAVNAIGTAATGYRVAYNEFLKAPARLMSPPVKRLSNEEIEAVLSGGATML